MTIDNGERLLFTSNFDGSWDSYIDEFIGKASSGLDAIWSHCVDFLEGGSKDREAFTTYVRNKYEHKAQRIREKFENLLDEFT